ITQLHRVAAKVVKAQGDRERHQHPVPADRERPDFNDHRIQIQQHSCHSQRTVYRRMHPQFPCRLSDSSEVTLVLAGPVTLVTLIPWSWSAILKLQGETTTS